MLHTVEDDIALCREFKLTPAQLMFVKMLVPDPTYDDSEWKKKSYKMAIEYQKATKGLKPEEIADLISRDIIIDHNDYGKCEYDYYEINPKFRKHFHLKVYPMPRELFDSYPIEIQSHDGRKFVGRTCSEYEMAKDYLRAINNDPEEHKQVMADLMWGKENKKILVGLKKFVTTRYWLLLRDKRNTQQSNTSNVTII